MNKLYSEFALVTRIKFPFFPWPNLIFYKPYVTSRNGPLMHNTTAYTSHIQNRNTWVIVDYHNELWENSKSSYTFVWATEKKVQELLSKSVQWHLSPCHTRVAPSMRLHGVQEKLRSPRCAQWDLLERRGIAVAPALDAVGSPRTPCHGAHFVHACRGSAFPRRSEWVPWERCGFAAAT